MKYPVKHTVHHLMPKSLGGSNDPSNLKALNDNFHQAFHRVFENQSPVGQIAQLAKFNAPILTLEFQTRVNELLKDAGDIEYVYRKGVLVSREEFIKSYR